MNTHYSGRYLASTMPEISRRVARTVYPDDNAKALYIEDLMNKHIFMPAGNTLVAGIKPIAPNCSVLGLVTDHNVEDITKLSIKLWTQGTGIGYDLSGLTDPVHVLRKLSSINHDIDLKHRPKRGNMAVLRGDHPRIKEFVMCKDIDGVIYNFNISVTVDTNMVIADDVWDCIYTQAWKTGDPGLLFLNNANNYGPIRATDLDPICTCVPCGEQFMHAYETCNLGSLNISSTYLRDSSTGHIDLNILKSYVHGAIEFLDTVVDLLVFPDPRMKQVSLDCRRLGLGITGWADYLRDMGIPYDSNEALELARTLSTTITAAAEECSSKLAQSKGTCKYSSSHRNISLTCIAPTGGITGLMNLEGYAIEPLFSEALSYDYTVHINMQIAWQQGIHNAVSKTINMPYSATIADVANAYKYAQTHGCKGITVYRDSCKSNQPKELGCTSCSSV